jgi:cysteine/O-acetylserine efflux protein
MSPNLLALASYVFVTTFTPGPNNVSSTSAGMRLGYRGSLPYLAGIASGFVVVMLLAGFFDMLLEARVAGFLATIKWIGFAYMLWLIAGLFLPHKGGKAAAGTYSFPSGFLLQVINVKVVLYGLTIYGMFPTVLAASNFVVLASAFALAAVGFISISIWCLIGTAFTRFLSDKRIMLGFNIALALLLMYCAYSIIAE